MAVFKCKMCGGNLEAAEGQNIGTCDSCGSTMTLPKANDERVLNLFNRATHYRQQNEFDKAIATYESILEEDNENAEAYWGLVLSKYGIEYVEDPKTHKRIPTCHRLQHESILSNLDYKSALKYALDYSAERLYREESEKIAEIQKNILSIANNEAPYDVFICYKETDNNGRRTIDSTLAQDIYYQLTNEGYKVFFSRITLEDKLGTEYEPYIFSALNSAKIMLVVGTNKDYYNAVWVKNEWARFLDLAKKDKSKMIIPCYRDMDAYDLPDELSMFQSQDMSKIGFIQDLIRGIKKVLQKNSAQPTVTVVNNTAEAFNSETILKRAFMLLEDAEWQKADKLLEQVLNHEPENARAYLGKLMSDVKVNKEENLGKSAVDFSENANYKKAVRFADSKAKSILQDYCNIAKKLHLQVEQNRLEKEKIEREIQQIEQHKLKIKTDILDMKIRCLLSIIFSGGAIGAISLFIAFGTSPPTNGPDIRDYCVFNAILVWVCSLLSIFCGGKFTLHDDDNDISELEKRAVSFKKNYIHKMKIYAIILFAVSVTPIILGFLFM
ncbi:MAG: TIR domain-containing protein [Clostridiales bacterium]|nr:TIR domain-containing protein [Clostridiales bacterium]